MSVFSLLIVGYRDNDQTARGRKRPPPLLINGSVRAMTGHRVLTLHSPMSGHSPSQLGGLELVANALEEPAATAKFARIREYRPQGSTRPVHGALHNQP